MAIIVPILVSYGATALGVAATTATMMATAASVVFQVTGVNDKINKAASKVFGEDLVMIANVAGAVYGAVNGGFDFGSGAEGAAGLTEAGGTLSAKAMLDGTDSFGLNSMKDAFPLADGVGTASLATGDFSGTTDAFGNSTLTPGDTTSIEMSAARTPTPFAPEVSKGVDLLDDGGALGKDAKALAAPPATNTSQGGAVGPQAAAADAAKPNASAAQNSMSKPGASATNASGLQAAGKPQANSFFDRLLSNDKAVGELIKGVGVGISGAANAKAEKDKLAWQKQRYGFTPTTRIVQ